MKYHGHRYNRNLRYLFITHELHFHFVTIKYTPRNPISTLQFPFPRIVTRISNSNRSTTSRTRIEQHHYLIISFRIFLDKKKKMKKYIYTYIYTNMIENLELLWNKFGNTWKKFSLPISLLSTFLSYSRDDEERKRELTRNRITSRIPIRNTFSRKILLFFFFLPLPPIPPIVRHAYSTRARKTDQTRVVLWVHRDH